VARLRDAAFANSKEPGITNEWRDNNPPEVGWDELHALADLLAEAADALAESGGVPGAVEAQSIRALTCRQCRHFLPWDRVGMRGLGDCHQPRLRGRLNGLDDESFGCLLAEAKPRRVEAAPPEGEQ